MEGNSDDVGMVPGNGGSAATTSEAVCMHGYAVVNMKEKFCKQCNTLKPAEEYSLGKRLKNGVYSLYSVCKPCAGDRSRERHKNLAEKNRERGTPAVTYKICARCQKKKCASAFPRKFSTTTGLGAYCKPCNFVASRERPRRRMENGGVIPESKICIHCKIDKPSSSYVRNAGSATGLRDVCKECTALQKQQKRLLPSGMRKVRRRRCPVCDKFRPLSTFYLLNKSSRSRCCNRCLLVGAHPKGDPPFPAPAEAQEGQPQPVVNQGHTVCWRCGKRKGVDDFERKVLAATGWKRVCRACDSKGQKLMEQGKQWPAAATHKVCSACKEDKLAAEFPRSFKTLSGLKARCLSCTAERELREGKKPRTNSLPMPPHLEQVYAELAKQFSNGGGEVRTEAGEASRAEGEGAEGKFPWPLGPTVYKTCSGCRKRKTAKEFRPDKRCNTGLSKTCKHCYKLQRKARRHNQPPPDAATSAQPADVAGSAPPLPDVEPPQATSATSAGLPETPPGAHPPSNLAESAPPSASAEPNTEPAPPASAHPDSEARQVDTMSSDATCIDVNVAAPGVKLPGVSQPARSGSRGAEEPSCGISTAQTSAAPTPNSGTPSGPPAVTEVPPLTLAPSGGRTANPLAEAAAGAEPSELGANACPVVAGNAVLESLGASPLTEGATFALPEAASLGRSRTEARGLSEDEEEVPLALLRARKRVRQKVRGGGSGRRKPRPEAVREVPIPPSPGPIASLPMGFVRGADKDIGVGDDRLNGQPLDFPDRLTGQPLDSPDRLNGQLLDFSPRNMSGRLETADGGATVAKLGTAGKAGMAPDVVMLGAPGEAGTTAARVQVGPPDKVETGAAVVVVGAAEAPETAVDSAAGCAAGDRWDSLRGSQGGVRECEAREEVDLRAAVTVEMATGVGLLEAVGVGGRASAEVSEKSLGIAVVVGSVGSLGESPEAVGALVMECEMQSEESPVTL